LSSVAKSVQSLVGDSTNTAVVISADRTVKYETVVKVMDSLQRVGIARVGLSVQLAP
jgi:biopolymer transport protein TolR